MTMRKEEDENLIASINRKYLSIGFDSIRLLCIESQNINLDNDIWYNIDIN